MSKLSSTVALFILIVTVAPIQAQDWGGPPIQAPSSDYEQLRLKIDSDFTRKEKDLLEVARDIIVDDFFKSDQVFSQMCDARAATLGTSAQVLHRALKARIDRFPELRSMMPSGHRSEDMVLPLQWVNLAEYWRSYLITGGNGWQVELVAFNQAPADPENCRPGGEPDMGCAVAYTFPDIQVVLDLKFNEGGIPNFTIVGNQFKMWVNQFYLSNRSARLTAATLVHEMLHNLGHNHPSMDSHNREHQIAAVTGALGGTWTNHNCSKDAQGRMLISE